MMFLCVFVIGVRRSGRRKDKGSVILENTIEETIDADAEESEEEIDEEVISV